MTEVTVRVAPADSSGTSASSPSARQSVAIIGMSCRFPGAPDVGAFWSLLRDGVDAVREVPAERWDIATFYDPSVDSAGKMVTRWGGFLDGVDQFDAEFFGISRREADRMDPQQRLVMETAWEALENAGIAPHSLRGGDAGVFIGIGNTDYMRMLCHDPARIDRYDGTGGTLSFAANRLSYFLDLHGPSLGMESACSSSLVALHTACRALRGGDTSLAIAGGVNLVLSPDMTVAFSQARMMSPTGRCRAFDAAADGYVRGEGCGIVILKRLDDALAEGDRILAVIRGSAINQDGTSNGITAPNGAAQQAVIRRACADAGVEPSCIGYVEAHGTGTRVGDPIEMHALKTVLGAGRPTGARCWVGSVKTNIGHLEAAAGIAGLIKTVLVLQHQNIPPHLHLNELNPYLSLDGTSFGIPRALQPWPGDRGGRIAGVSGFSFGGTNCHLIVEEAPLEPARDAVAASACLLPLSARSLPALRALADRYRRHLRTDASQPLADICRTSGHGRDHFPHRLAVTGTTAAELADRLSAWCEGCGDWGGVQKTVSRHASPEAVFLFTGQGAGHAGAGRRLYRDHAGFRRAIDRCDDVLRSVGSPCSVGHLLGAGADAPISPSRDPALVQPAIFALGYALAEVWSEWRIQPRAVIGHSLGEYVAACVAGVFSLEDALTLVAERGRLTGALAEPGVMAIVFASEEAVTAALGCSPGRLSIAAVNGPRATVVSGDAVAVDTLLRSFADRRIEGQLLETTHAFHSPLMVPMVARFRATAERIAYRTPTIPLVAGLSGAVWHDGAGPDSDYWCRHLLEPVRFVDGLRSLANGRSRVIVELGAGAVLTRQAKRCGLGDDLHFVASLPPAMEENEALLAALGTFYVHGHNVDWQRLYARSASRPVALPTYPFQRQRHWYRDPQPEPAGVGEGAVADPVTLHAVPADAAEMAPRTSPASAVPVMPSADYAPLRAADLLSIIRTEFAELLHGNANANAIDEDASFLELGADSLVLVDAVHKIEQRFGVRISVQQLFDEIPTPRALAEYLTARAPAALPPVSCDAPVAPCAAPAPASLGGALAADSDLAELMRQQLSLLQRQLAILQARPGVGYRVAAPPACAPAEALMRAQPTDVVTQSSGGASLSVEQRRYLDRLIERYVARTGGSRARAAGARPMLADSRASAGFRRSIKEMLYPIVGSRGEGARFWDVDGNEYIDITMGFGVSLFGHQPGFVGEALAAQWQQGLQIGPQSPLAGDVAGLIRELTGVERVAFCNTGTEAVMTAVRLARAVTGRARIALFAGSYHGHSDGMLAAAPTRPSSAGVTPGAVADVLVLDYGAPQSLDILDQCGDELAAILVEPVQSRHPDLQPRDFLHRLREIATRRGAALVFDEVLTGFRVHPGGAQAWFGVRADIVCYGKIVGGGLPIGIVAGLPRFLNGIDGGDWAYGDASSPHAETIFFAGTFNKNHLAMATAHAVLTHLKAAGPALQETLNARTKRLADALNRELTRRRATVRVVHFGSLFRFQVSGNLDPFFYGLIEKGLYVWEGRTCFLSTAHTDADVEQVVERVSVVLDEMAEAGWFAGGSMSGATQAPVALPPPAELEQNLRSTMAELRDSHDLAAYTSGMALLERRAVDHVHAAFTELGYRAQTGVAFSGDGLAATLGIVPIHHRLFRRLLQILAEDGYLEQVGPDQWRIVSATQSGETDAPTEPAFEPVRHELDLLDHCGRALADVLRGRRHPLEVLVPGGDLEPLRALYATSPMARAMNTLIRDAVAAAVDAVPSDSVVRIHEVGAGTGGTTAYVVPILPADRVEYVFSDLSPRFLDAARRQFAPYPFLHYRVLDIEQPPPRDERADIVIAANVLHATTDLGRTLHHLQLLLRPGGLLFVLEGSGRARWLDLVFGLTEGWWRFADAGLRPDYPLLEADAWLDLMRAHGFVNPVALRSDGRQGAGAQVLLIAGTGRRLALNPTQRAIWVASQLGPVASAAYNESITVVLRGSLDRDALARAVSQLIQRHDALRLTIAPDGAHQAIGPVGHGPMPIPTVLGPGDCRARAREWLAGTLTEPFDLSNGPPVRFHLLELDDTEHWLVMIVHHVVIDGLSLLTLARDLGLYYAALAKGKSPDLPRARSFAAYLERTDPAVQPDRWAAGRDYWRARLAAPVQRIDLPLDRPRVPVRAHAGARARADMAADLPGRLATMASAHGCTLFMALLAGFRVLLYRLLGTDEVVVGISAAGQSADGLNRLVGCCVNVLPLRCGGEPDLSVAELLRHVRRIVLDAYEHQWVALADLVHELDLPREPGRPPLIDAHFNYDKVETGIDYGPLAVELAVNGSGSARRDLTWNPVEADGRLSLIVDYDADLFDASTVEGWMAEYEWVLDRMAGRPDLSMAALAAEIAAMRTGSLTRLGGDRLRAARRRAVGPA